MRSTTSLAQHAPKRLGACVPPPPLPGDRLSHGESTKEKHNSE